MPLAYIKENKMKKITILFSLLTLFEKFIEFFGQEAP
jgi:hypothetical protein